MTIKDLVRDGNSALFNRYIHGSEGATLYYLVWDYQGDTKNTDCYEFPIPASEIENTQVTREMKALTLMRWIRKAMDNGTLVKIN